MIHLRCSDRQSGWRRSALTPPTKSCSVIELSSTSSPPRRAADRFLRASEDSIRERCRHPRNGHARFHPPLLFFGCDMNTVANNALKRRKLKFYNLLTSSEILQVFMWRTRSMGEKAATVKDRL
jgi:hypothetical protein